MQIYCKWFSPYLLLRFGWFIRTLTNYDEEHDECMAINKLTSAFQAGYDLKALSFTLTYLNSPVSQFLHRNSYEISLLLDSNLLVVFADKRKEKLIMLRWRNWELKCVGVQDRASRGQVSVLEIMFVGQCEVFFCLDFVLFFPPWMQRVSILQKMLIFPTPRVSRRGT